MNHTPLCCSTLTGKVPTNGVCLPLNRARVIVVADVWECITTSEDVCARVCEHVSTWRRSAGHIFVAAPLSYSRVCVWECLLECVRACAISCMRVRARARETSRGVNLFKWAGEDNERMGWGVEVVCVRRGAPSSAGGSALHFSLSLPLSLVFSRLQMRLFAWLRRREAREMGGGRRWDWKKRKTKNKK